MTDPTSVQIVSKSLSAVAKALRDVIDSFAHAVRLGTSGVDAVRERQMTAMLYDLINRTKRQLYSQGVVARSLDDFIARQERGQSTGGAYGWEEVRKDIRGNMEFAAEIMETLSAQNNAFAATDAFQPLLEAVGARDRFFQALLDMPLPESPEDIAALRVAVEDWQAMRVDLQDSIDGLQAHIAARAGAKD